MKTDVPRFLATVAVALTSQLAIVCINSGANAQNAMPQMALRMSICQQTVNLLNNDPNNPELQQAVGECNYLVQAFGRCQYVEASRVPSRLDIAEYCAGEEIVGQITPMICEVTRSYLGESYLQEIYECY
jgi:hypothetical protein